jgi:hypothetical protein
MPTPLHQFLTTATEKAATDLEAAYLKLPEDKRNWSPMGAARTAADMVAECAIMNEVSGLIQSRMFPADFDYGAFQRATGELSQDGEKLLALLHENTARGIAAIRTVSSDDLGIEIALPFGKFTLGQIMAYPYWNMSYHEGQITYIGTMLGL